MNVPPSRKAKIFIVTDKKDTFNDDTAAFFSKLASASAVSVCDSYYDENAVQIITDAATLYIPLADMIDYAKERERLTKEREIALGEISRIEKKLSNEGFTAKAPAAVIDGEREKLRRYRDTLDGIEKALEKIKS
jgi:valyl-tRNA synthetase